MKLIEYKVEALGKDVDKYQVFPTTTFTMNFPLAYCSMIAIVDMLYQIIHPNTTPRPNLVYLYVPIFDSDCGLNEE